MKPTTLAFILLGLYTILCFCGCQQTGSAPKLQSHLSNAQTSTAKTSQHISSIKTHLDTADYKGSRAQKLLNQGIDQ